MRFWRWILVALVVLTLGSVLLPTTSSAADRSGPQSVGYRIGDRDSGRHASALWRDSNSELMGDPDGGTGSGGYSSTALHDFRLQRQQPSPSFVPIMFYARLHLLMWSSLYR